jgi:GNAT superfamily N-acetyltransferase
MINDCVTQTLFNLIEYQGHLEYKKLSKRFHFALSKKIDGSNTYGGVMGIAGQRAFEGWVPCHEFFFQSKKCLTEQTYGNWNLIPKLAWWDSIRRTTIRDTQRLKYYKQNPSKALIFSEHSLNGKTYTLLAQSDFGMKDIFGGEIQVDFSLHDWSNINVAWLKTDIFVKRHFLRVSDLYVKEGYRNQGLGSLLTQEMLVWISHQELPCGPFPIVLMPHIIDVSTSERKQVTLAFLSSNGFQIYYHRNTPQLGDYSKIIGEYIIQI